jgi:hypothetical protein
MAKRVTVDVNATALIKGFERLKRALRGLNFAAAYGLEVFAKTVGRAELAYFLADHAIRHYEQAGPWAEMLNRNKINWV